MKRRPPNSPLFPYTTLFRSNAALILGHADGYMEYVATAEEYTAQYYEGASTLYGPGEAAMFGRTLARLTASVDRKSTRLNSSHPSISYAVFCLKKKNKNNRA